MEKIWIRVLFLILSIVISIIINTLYIDKLLDIFNIMSLVALLLNRVSVSLFIYFSLEILFIIKKFELMDIINKSFLIYSIWLIGLLFGRFTHLQDYNVDKHFNFQSYLPLWIHNLDHPLVRYYIIGNILVYIPFGLFIRYYKNFIYSFLYSILIILFFESLQGVTNLGYFDIDDVLLNGIGGLIGIMFMHFYKKYFILKHK